MNTRKQWISPDDLFCALEEQLAENRQALFTVTGMSMWPFLHHGRDQVVLAAVKPEDIRTGDIVLLRARQGRYLLHRVTKKTPMGIETTGDSNCFRDGLFPYGCVIGRTVTLIRAGKTIDCGAWQWKLVFRCWMLLFPLRKQLIALWKQIRGIK